MNPAARRAWARTELLVWPETYHLVRFGRERLAEVAAWLARGARGFAALVVDHGEVSLTVAADAGSDVDLPAEAVPRAGPFRVITFDVVLEMELTGYLAPALERLATRGVPVIPQCGFTTDHLLVPAARLADAERELRVLIATARDG